MLAGWSFQGCERESAPGRPPASGVAGDPGHSLTCRRPVPLLHLHIASPCVCLPVQISSFYKDTSLIG